MPAVTESITKNRQPTAVLQAMLTRALGPDAVLDDAHEITHGWFNVVYRVRLRSGRTVVVKVAPPAGVDVLTYERDMLATEVRALRLVREHTDVPVPDVLFVDDSRELCDADWFVMSFVDGDNLSVVQDSLTRDERDAYDHLLGAANRTLNAIVGDHFGPIGGPGGTQWRPVFLGMLDDVLVDGERLGVDLGHSYDDIRAVVAAHADCLDEVVEPRFVEWDLWTGNVLVRDGVIAGIVDHERALYGDPLIESGFTSAGTAAGTAFLRGYGRGPLTPSETRRRRLYDLYLFLVMTIETVYRGHTDPSQYDWARTALDEAILRARSDERPRP
ncbi:phosphotransferase family protein [Cellulomonas sp. URHE0023]|uniref:phosphotransferase family protein n=1 Tax=Cellulomonas sp. URHE0023 TaxID=1380354 RepID=UPI0004847EF1|nr:aminoglycoside phosphotransferase family protein [Cellulomonas sp. URHE0023]